MPTTNTNKSACAVHKQNARWHCPHEIVGQVAETQRSVVPRTAMNAFGEKLHQPDHHPSSAHRPMLQIMLVSQDLGILENQVVGGAPVFYVDRGTTGQEQRELSLHLPKDQRQ